MYLDCICLLLYLFGILFLQNSILKKKWVRELPYYWPSYLNLILCNRKTGRQCSLCFNIAYSIWIDFQNRENGNNIAPDIYTVFVVDFILYEDIAYILIKIIYRILFSPIWLLHKSMFWPCMPDAKAQDGVIITLCSSFGLSMHWGQYKMADILKSNFYYPRPVLAFGYCRWLPLSVCVSVCGNTLLVRTITCHPLKLESPNSDQKSKTPWLRSLLFRGVIDFELEGQI